MELVEYNCNLDAGEYIMVVHHFRLNTEVIIGVGINGTIAWRYLNSTSLFPYEFQELLEIITDEVSIVLNSKHDRFGSIINQILINNIKKYSIKQKGWI